LTSRRTEQPTPVARVWRARDAAAYVGEGLANFYKLVAAGFIPSFRQGKRSLRFDRVALDAWLDSKDTPSKRDVIAD